MHAQPLTLTPNGSGQCTWLCATQVLCLARIASLYKGGLDSLVARPWELEMHEGLELMARQVDEMEDGVY